MFGEAAKLSNPSNKEMPSPEKIASMRAAWRAKALPDEVF